MRWMLNGPWPITGALLPAGTLISDGGDPSAIPVVELPQPLPINAVALDEDAALTMAMWYEESASIGGWHQLHFAPGIDRDAIFATARHKKRWPNGEPSPSRTMSGPSFPAEALMKRLLLH